MVRRAALFALAWLCLTCFAVAQTLSFPALTGRVVDQAGLLTEADRAAITQSLADLEARTTDQLVVVTLKSLQGTSVEDYGYQLGRVWHIGQKDKDSGVLLIVAPQQRSVRIEVGYGLEGSLTDAATKVIIESAILPSFKAGDFAGGVRNGVGAIIRTLSADAPEGSTSPRQAAASGDGSQATPVPLWVFIVLGLAGVTLLILCTVTRGGGLCRGIMQIIFLMMLSGRGGSSRGKDSFSGGGGSFGGGGSSGSW